MNKKAKRFICNVLMAYAALAVVMALIGFQLIPAGIFAMIALQLALVWVNFACCRWMMDKAIDVTGIPRKDAYAYYSSLLGRKNRHRRRYWHRWVAERTENFEEFCHWDRLANWSLAPAMLFTVLCVLSTYPGLQWLPNTLVLGIPLYCLLPAWRGVCYHLMEI